MRTEGTMKVVVFEIDSTKESTATAVGKLFSEAVSWLQWVSLEEIQVGPKKKGKRQLRNLSLSLSEIFEEKIPEGEDGYDTSSTMQLFIHFDDNEYPKEK